MRSTVTYLTSIGSPTAVFNAGYAFGNIFDVEEVGKEAWFIMPKVNKHISFQGDLYHGIFHHVWPSPVKKLRVTLLVNYWDKMPMEPYCRPLDDSMMRDMVGQEAMDRAAAAWPAARAQTGEYETTHRETRCAANQISLAPLPP